jgi:hypothetical protein
MAVVNRLGSANLCAIRASMAAMAALAVSVLRFRLPALGSGLAAG